MLYKSIVISGTPLSGKSTVCKILSEKYGWPVQSIGGIWRKRYAELYPKKEITFEEFWGRTTAAENVAVNEYAKALFEKGEVIGDSRYVSYLDRSKCLLVFIDADIDIRAERAANREEYKHLSFDERKKILQKRDADELRLGQDLLNINYKDAKLYHLVLDSGKMTPQEEVEKIFALMRPA